MANPFLLPNPSVVSFSGGRTSGYMLHRIIEAFGGRLPEWVRVIFCNTGKERPETLDFVERCSQRWDVPITWLEYRWEPGRHYFEEVDYATASHNGEPFRLAIEARGRAYLPNPVQRFCTAELKVKTTNRFARKKLGWDTYTNAIGLRGDEKARVLRIQRRSHVKREPSLFDDGFSATLRPPPGESTVFPLYESGNTVDDVMAFWSKAPFDLAVAQTEGNCDLCFLKSTKTLTAIMAKRPDLAEWWIRMEGLPFHSERREVPATFRNDRPTYAKLLAIAQGREAEPGWLWADKDTGACGEIAECRCTD